MKKIFCFIIFVFVIGISCQKELEISKNIEELTRIINSIPNEIDLDDEAVINSAIEKFNSLSDEEKKVFDSTNLFNKKAILDDLIKRKDDVVISVYYNDESVNCITLYEKTSIQILCEAIPSCDNSLFYYESNDEKIVKINKDAIIYGLEPGNAKILIRAIGKNGSFELNIVVLPQPVIDSIKISSNIKEMYIDEEYTFVCETEPIDIDTEIVWSTSENGSIDSNGFFIPLNIGLCQVTVVDAISNKSSIIEFNIIERPIIYEKIEILKDNEAIEVIELTVEDVIVLSTLLYPNIDTDIIWSSSDDSILSVINGECKAKKAGKVNLSVVIKNTNIGATISINVKDKIILPDDIEIVGEKSCFANETIQLQVYLYPDNASSNIVWKSSNEDIAIVNEGLVTALNIGEVSIHATTDNNVSSTFKLTVKDKNVNYDISLLNGITREMINPYYWLNISKNVDEIILTEDEINEVNEESLSKVGTNLVDIRKSATTIAKSSLITMINKYTYNSNYYINGRTTSQDYANKLTLAKNLNNISDNTIIEYGLINTFCSLRSFPTSDVATRSGSSFDRFQETGLNVGEMVLIYHNSTDNKWSFVQAMNYNGWVLNEYINKYTKEECLSYINNSNLIVTAERIVVDGLILRMGSKLPIVKEENDNYIAKVPYNNGFKEIKISKQLDINKGFLTYNLKNVLIQAFKLIGNPYNWGDSTILGRDCSSTMNAIYQCFGFIMPRNTSNQQNMALPGLNINSYSYNSKINVFNQLKAGSLIFSSGHVMMFIGEINNNYYILHNSTSNYNCCNVSKVDLSSIIYILNMEK